MLPLWAAEPSVAEGRVFLYRGERIVWCQHLEVLPVGVGAPKRG